MGRDDGLCSHRIKQKIPSPFEKWEVFLSGHLTPAGGKGFIFMEKELTPLLFLAESPFS
jgi:hypothetical protein